VIAVTVPEGLDKPYFDRQGVIWLKAGADKRRVQSKEELRRLFQDVDLLQADQVPTGAGVNDLDRIRFRDFLSGTFQEPMPEKDDALLRLLENMNLAQSGQLNLAGLLLFGLRPQVHLYRDRAIDGRKKCTYKRPECTYKSARKCTFSRPAAEHVGPHRVRSEHLVRRPGDRPETRSHHRDAQYPGFEDPGPAPAGRFSEDRAMGHRELNATSSSCTPTLG